MRKVFGSFACIALLVATYAVATGVPRQWDGIDAGNVTGGTCYAFTMQNCTGGTTECGAVLCNSMNGGQSWTCNVTSVTIKKGTTYNSACPSVDNGGWTSCVTSTRVCSETTNCGQFCVPNPATGLRYCDGAASPPVPNNVGHHEPGDTASGC